MMKHSYFYVALVCLIGIGTLETQAGPKGVIVVRPFGPGVSIQIDGDFSDWPLAAYEKVSEQPLFPDGQDALTTDARGDYLVYDPDRVGFFNYPRGAVSEDDPNLDFEVNTYFAYDDNYLYVLSIFVDDEIVGDRDTSAFGNAPYLNDGQEFFFDAKNDSDDCISDIAFPSIDNEEPNLDDFQVGTGINDLLDPVLPMDQGGWGAVQGIIRSGNRDLLGSGNFNDGTYQAALAASPGPDIAAKAYADLRAAGAPNPMIAQNPGLTFAGYALETRIPFRVVDGFTPDHNIGMTIFWRDVDYSNGTSIQFIDWAQSSTAGGCTTASAEITDIFFAPNWGSLEFNPNNPLGGTAIPLWEIFK
ncbi:MAG: hypothetical protein HPY51_16105 [Candidatus Omnitrophica bacterium]|nr:hypothetical protein [Candidatus Omnitrophota bacterium]HXK92542.1 hypothetical protein [bacterium]